MFEEIVTRIIRLEKEVRDLKTLELNHVSGFKVDNTLDVVGNFNVSGTSTLTGNLLEKGNLQVNGTSLFVGNSVEQGNLQVGGTLYVSGTAQFVGDLYTDNGWTDYSGTSTVTGWSSFTSKQICCKKVGKLVFCAFNLNGTSNTGTSSFTLPYTSAANPVAFQSVHSGSDNGGAYAFGRAGIAANSNLVSLYKDAASTAWTASGAKHIRGLIWYESG